MTPPNTTPTKPGIVWMKTQWKLKQNPFPNSGIAVLGGEDPRENGLLFQPEVQHEKVAEAIEKFVLGAAYSGLKFGYLWSLGTGLSPDARGFGKSSMLQYLVEHVNRDFGRQFFVDCGLEESDAEEAPLCAVLASFDMANARSLAAVFFSATTYACRFRIGDEPTLAARLRARLVQKLGTDDPTELTAAVYAVNDNLRGRTLGPPIQELVRLLCAGEIAPLVRFLDSVKEGARGRVSAANYFATILLFAKTAGIPHVLLGCDQLEDFAATTTGSQKRRIEVERFRDYVLELQPMADMLTVVVTLHPRAQQTIGTLWRLADLPDPAPDRAENQSRVVVLDTIDDVERAKSLLRPYLDAARTAPVAGEEFAPFTEDAMEILLTRSDGKPRDILRKGFALIEQGSSKNWDRIDGHRAASILDSLVSADEDEEAAVVIPSRTDERLEAAWTL
jgi:hypothetical protein